MKKTFLLKTMLLLFALIAGVNGSWAEDVTYTISSKNNLTTSGTAPSGSSATMAETYSTSCQMTSGNSQTLTLSGYSSCKITNITLSMKSNSKGGAGKLSYSTDGGTTWNYIIGSSNSGVAFNQSAWYGSWSTQYVDISKDVEITATTSNLVIKIEATANSLYCQSYKLTYENASSSLSDCDLALTNAPLSLSFDLYNNSAAQTIRYTTSSTGAVTVSASDYVTTSIDETNKTITVTPKAVTPSAQTITVNQAATDTYAAGSATFTVSITAKHAVKFSVNGVITTTEVNEGAAIVFPADPEDIAGKSFVGWTATAIDGTTNNAPTFVTSATMGTADVTFYAVFANVTKGTSAEVTDELTLSTTGVSGTTYSEWSDESVTSNAVYAGQSAGDNNAIQLRSNNSNSGIITTTSGGKLKKVSVVWNSNTASGRTLDIYGKSTAYEAAADLYNNSKQGTKLGSIVKGTSTELDVNGDYSYIGLRSNSGAMYLDKISITWETGTPDTYSDYCTTVPAPESVSATIANSGYTTFCSPFDLSFESVSNLEAAYVVTTSTTSTATLKKVTAVPAGTGVILKGTTGPVTIPVAEYTGSEISNILVGTLTATPVVAETVYVVSDGKFKLFAGTEIHANKAYLPTSALTGNAPSLSFDFGGETTDINSVERGALSVEGCYTLDGRRVAEPTKGLYIVNGRKVIIK